MGLLDALRKNSSDDKKGEMEVLNQNLMLSQYAAFYVKAGIKGCKDKYIHELKTAGVSEAEANAMFDFDCMVIEKTYKPHLIDYTYKSSWIFKLDKPYFSNYPNTKKDILSMKYLTISELCKIIDEAEWHFYNSHEKQISSEVWGEICDWKMRGKGGAFVIGEYLPMICSTVNITMNALQIIVNHEGGFLNKYKWS